MLYLQLFSTSPGLLSDLDFTEKAAAVSTKTTRPSLGKPALAAFEYSFGGFETASETRRSLASGAARSGSAASSPGRGDLV